MRAQQRRRQRILHLKLQINVQTGESFSFQILSETLDRNKPILIFCMFISMSWTLFTTLPNLREQSDERQRLRSLLSSSLRSHGFCKYGRGFCKYGRGTRDILPSWALTPSWVWPLPPHSEFCIPQVDCPPDSDLSQDLCLKLCLEHSLLFESS